MKAPFQRAESSYVHIFLRTDLPLATQMVQACHAARRLPPPNPDDRLVLLAVPDADSLWAVRDRLALRGLDPVVIEEPDHDHGATAVAVASGPGGRIGSSRFPLWTVL